MAPERSESVSKKDLFGENYLTGRSIFPCYGILPKRKVVTTKKKVTWYAIVDLRFGTLYARKVKREKVRHNGSQFFWEGGILSS
ncbi:hypothetical protein HZH66_002203 [Vespula vulgaris]|uniref:Uncharacterized protein n=1 Tax=Vespula vulgaris TaxID=7454 RepID=A0A834KKQ1_VESVU|nr:hypothetical protein HZH66_002203 [Vespula vulgaris]